MNKKKLLEDVKFPLKWDSKEYKMYIFDADMNMIAQVDDDNLNARENEHPFEKLIGDFKETPVSTENNRYFLHQGDFYDQKLGKRIGLVRGWGRLKYNDDPENRQDNIAEYILIQLNKKLK